MTTLTLELSEADVERIADAVAARLAVPRPHATIAEAARELRVSPRTVHRHIALGRLRTTKVGSRVLVLRDSIDALLGGG